MLTYAEKKARRTKVRKQPELFDYQEHLRGVLSDLRNIRGLIPAESSRYGCLVKDTEAAAIIEARKSDLLRYIQVICDDHLFWGEQLLERSKVVVK